MRSREERLQRLACAEHCRFFKPWTGEERRCRAYQWLLKRVMRQEQVLDDLEKLRGQNAMTPLAHDAILLRTICAKCEYYPGECGYRNPAGPRSSKPCGGMLALALLLERDAVSPEGLYDQP